MGRTKYFRERYATIAQQHYDLGLHFPQFRRVESAGDRAIWRGTLHPTALSDFYTVQIAYDIPSRPAIRIISPVLRKADGQTEFPHTFEDGTLCVHQASEWNGRMLIARTIVPWICAWVYFYEVWLKTGAWEGEGTHPNLPQHRSVGASS